MKQYHILIIIGVILFILLQYNLWFSQNGIMSSHYLAHTMQHVKAENQNIEDKNNQLKEDIQQLKHNPSAIAAKARENFGMIKPGETYYNIVGDHDNKIQSS